MLKRHKEEGPLHGEYYHSPARSGQIRFQVHGIAEEGAVIVRGTASITGSGFLSQVTALPRGHGDLWQCALLGSGNPGPEAYGSADAAGAREGLPQTQQN